MSLGDSDGIFQCCGIRLSYPLNDQNTAVQHVPAGSSTVNPAAHHLGYFVPVSMHQYAYIELTGKGEFLSFKKKN